MAVQDYPGAAEELALSAGINASVTAFSVSDTPTANWPTGSNGFFVVVLDPGVSGKEEKVKVTTRSGTSFSTVERGYDGTTAATHSTGAKVQASIDALSFARANKAVVQTIEKATTAGHILIVSGSEAFAAAALSGDVTMDSSGVVTIGAGKVTAAKVAADVATQAELDAHTSDATAAHAASAISFSAVGTIAGTDAQTAIAEVATDAATALASHEADTTSVHGITDTSALLDATHTADTTSVHGFDDTAAIPRGVLGYAEVTSAQVNLVSAGSDLTGLSVTVTAGTSRRIRITGSASINNAQSQTVTLRIQESTTVLQQNLKTPSVTTGLTYLAVAVLTPNAGEHTYKLVGSSSSSTADMNADTDQPAFILVEDIGSSA